MLTLVYLSLLLNTPPSADAVRTYESAGEAHLRRAATPGEHQLDAFEGAHKNFDSAYLVTHDPRYLCRALKVAEVALTRVRFANDQERISWVEVQADDLDRLREDAAQTRRANCRFTAMATPMQSRVALFTDADLPDARLPIPPERTQPELAPPGPTRKQLRRGRAHTAVGAGFTTVGLGLVGVLAGSLGVQLRRVEEMRGIFDRARAAGELSEVDRGRATTLYADSIQTMNMAIGVGIAAVASLTTGITLLATRKRAARRFALLPLGGGAAVRLRF